MDQPLIMGMLQGGYNRIDIGDDRLQGKACPFGMSLAQCAVGGIGHRQERGIVGTKAKVQQLHNVGVLQAKRRAGLVNKLLQVLGRQSCLQQLDPR